MAPVHLASSQDRVAADQPGLAAAAIFTFASAHQFRTGAAF
jgi:hypothetical protein